MAKVKQRKYGRNPRPLEINPLEIAKEERIALSVELSQAEDALELIDDYLYEAGGDDGGGVRAVLALARHRIGAVSDKLIGESGE